MNLQIYDNLLFKTLDKIHHFLGELVKSFCRRASSDSRQLMHVFHDVFARCSMKNPSYKCLSMFDHQCLCTLVSTKVHRYMQEYFTCTHVDVAMWIRLGCSMFTMCGCKVIVCAFWRLTNKEEQSVIQMFLDVLSLNWSSMFVNVWKTLPEAQRTQNLRLAQVAPLFAKLATRLHNLRCHIAFDCPIGIISWYWVGIIISQSQLS